MSASLPVQDVGWKTLALSFAALHILGTVPCAVASNLYDFAMFSGIAGVPWAADAIVAASAVETIGVSAAGREFPHFDAFVDVATKALVIQGETSWTNTEAITRAGEDAFLVLGTGVGGGTIATDEHAVLPVTDKRQLARAMSTLITIIQTHGISGTLIVSLARDNFWVASRVRISRVSSGAMTDIAAFQIHAKSVESAGGFALVFGALVDVSAFSRLGVSGVASQANALIRFAGRDAFLLSRTRHLFGADDLRFVGDAAPEGVSEVTVRTNAIVRTGVVAAEGVLSARIPFGGTLVDVHATRQGVGPSGKPNGADANGPSGMVQLTVGFVTAEDVVARMSAIVSEVGCSTVTAAFQASGFTGTLIVFPALNRHDALVEGVPIGSRWTTAVEAAWRIGADCATTAFAVRPEGLGAFVDILTAYPSVSGETTGARAGEAAQGVAAEGVVPAFTIDAVSSVAFVDIFAIPERVAGEPRWTGTMVTSGDVGANRPLTAKTRRTVTNVAFVDVYATGTDVGRVESET